MYGARVAPSSWPCTASICSAVASEPLQFEPPASTMSRPVIPVTQHDEPEQLTLAEKLGLRAPGEKPDPTIEQNVGPTR